MDCKRNARIQHFDFIDNNEEKRTVFVDNLPHCREYCQYYYECMSTYIIDSKVGYMRLLFQKDTGWDDNMRKENLLANSRDNLKVQIITFGC